MVSETQRAVLMEMTESGTAGRLICVPHDDNAAYLSGRLDRAPTVRLRTWTALLSGGYIEEFVNNSFEAIYRLTPAGREVVS